MSHIHDGMLPTKHNEAVARGAAPGGQADETKCGCRQQQLWDSHWIDAR